MKVQVGVYNIPYGDENITTAEVAAILEKRYGLMAELARRSLPILSKEITKKTVQKLYGNVSGDDNLHETQDYMRHLIKSKAFDGNLKGVPTDASLAGKRSKFKKGKTNKLERKYFTTDVRPSFIDSGYFITSLHAKLIND